MFEQSIVPHVTVQLRSVGLLSDIDQKCMFGVGVESVCYYVLGTGLLMPWNAFITASDYYSKEFPGRHVDRLITISYLPVNLLVLGLLLSCKPRSQITRSNARILGGFCVYSFTMLLIPVMDMLGILSLYGLLFLVTLSGAADVRCNFECANRYPAIKMR